MYHASVRVREEDYEINCLLSSSFDLAATGSLTRVFRKTEGEWRSEDLLLEEVLLVEEQDDGGVAEPLVVAYRVEQFERLLHSILEKEGGGRRMK